MGYESNWDQPPDTLMRVVNRIFLGDLDLSTQYILPVLGILVILLIILQFFQHKKTENTHRRFNVTFQHLMLLGASVFIPSLAISSIILIFYRIALIIQFFVPELKKNEHRWVKRFPIAVILISSGLFLVAGVILSVLDLSMGLHSIIGVVVIGSVFYFKRAQLHISGRNNIFLKPISKRKTIALGGTALLVIVLGSGLIYVQGLAVHPAAPESNPSPNTTSLRIVTYNILYDINPDIIDEAIPWEWEYRKDHVIDYMKEMDAEIFGLQECFPAQIEYFLGQLTNRNYRFCGYGNMGDKLNFWNNPIFYDADLYKYLDGDTFWHSNSPGTPLNDWINQKRICTWARFEVKVTGAQFCVFNTHFGFNADREVHDNYQIDAAKLVTAKIAEYSGGLPAFLLADFNLNMNDPAYPYLINQPPKILTDAYAEYHSSTDLPETIDTFNGMRSNFNFTSGRIDMIFTTNDIFTENITVSQKFIYYEGNPNQYFPSDHFPVILDCLF